MKKCNLHNKKYTCYPHGLSCRITAVYVSAKSNKKTINRTMNAMPWKHPAFNRSSSLNPLYGS